MRSSCAQLARLQVSCDGRAGNALLMANFSQIGLHARKISSSIDPFLLPQAKTNSHSTARANKPDSQRSRRPSCATVYSIEQTRIASPISQPDKPVCDHKSAQSQPVTSPLEMVDKVSTSILLVAFLTQICDHILKPSNALRMINLDAPQMALEGDTIQLSCSYSLVTPSKRVARHDIKLTGTSDDATELSEPETVYAIKWYRDEIEFFRYLTRDWPHKQTFNANGLNIDVEKSDNQTVVLRNVSLTTSGVFRCEVSTDAPSFLTKSIERSLLIHHLPSEGPLIEHLSSGTDRHLHIGAQLNLRCISKESKPAAQIDWIINDTLNLTSIENLPTESSGRPLIELTTRRIVNLPPSYFAERSPRSASSWPPRFRERSQSELVYLVDSSSPKSPQLTSHSSLAHQQLKGYKLDNLDKIVPDGLIGNSISLTASSFHHLLESSISWLNLTVNNNLLQFLSDNGAFPDKPARPDVTWSTRKIVGAAANFTSSLNQTSRGTLFAKTRRRIGSASGMQQKSSPTTRQQGGKVSLRVRCVARVLHLSLSGDVRLHLLNKTLDQVEKESPDWVMRNLEFARSGSRFSWMNGFYEVPILILRLFITVILVINIYC